MSTGCTKLSAYNIQICLFVLFAALSFSSKAIAGPVERELILRGSNVGTPIRRPLTTNLDRPAKNLLNSTKAKPAELADLNIPKFDESCFSRLNKIAVAERADQPASTDNQCVIPTPIILKNTRNSSPVTFANGLLLDCEFAETLVKFTSSDLQHAAQKNIQSPLVKVGSGQGFVCRRRNNLPTGKLSEHAFGNALDFIGFVFANGTSMNVKSAEEMPEEQAKFFVQIRKAACTSFTTVLGPGTNAAHATHLHVDLGRSKGNPNPYRICE